MKNGHSDFKGNVKTQVYSRTALVDFPQRGRAGGSFFRTRERCGNLCIPGGTILASEQTRPEKKAFVRTFGNR